MKETGITKNQIIAELTRSPHGKLAEYVSTGRPAAKQEPEFFAHLIAWNQIKGQIRDSRVALPIIQLQVVGSIDAEFRDSALAHLSLLDPRNLLRAYRFAMESRDLTQDRRNVGQLDRMITRKLRTLESNWAKWERVAVQHRKSLKGLYALLRIKPAPMADAILFKRQIPRGSVFDAIRNLSKMSATEAAGTILERRIPFLIASGALGAKMKDPTLVLALIERMSPNELVNNSKMLERLGIKTVPALRAAYEQALGRAAGSKTATFKATRAAEAIEEDEDSAGIAQKLRDLQEKQIKALGGVEGNWLVAGDKSGSMSEAIEISRHVAGTLAKMVKGEVHLVFFDTLPIYKNVTGQTYEQIKELTKNIRAGGGTSVGCSLLALAEKKVEVDGIAIVSDGGENTPPMFAATYKAYCQAMGKEVPVYLYRTAGEPDQFSHFMATAGIDVQKFDLSKGVDYYSLPNIVQTMRTQRYSLADEIMECPLLKLDQVFDAKEALAVA